MMGEYRVNLTRLLSSDAFCDASRDELRVLLALASLSGEPTDRESLAEICQVSEARVGAAFALWQESGIVEEGSEGATVIMDPWTASDDRPIIAESKTELAESIRDSGTSDMINECTAMMGGVALSTRNIASLTRLVTEEGLTPEYVLTLASHMLPSSADGAKLTTYKLCKKANELIALGIDSLSELEGYIAESENQKEYEKAICRIVGRKSTKISKNERALYSRWVKDFGFGLDIIEEAFEICNAITHSYTQKYMDSILESWFNAGCRTLEECRDYTEKHREQLSSAGRTGGPGKKAHETDTAKYTVFDAEDALMSALARSYGNEEN